MTGPQLLEAPSTDAQDVEPCHVVHEDALAPALAAGTPVTALCGHVWVPTRRRRDGDPWCRRCIELGVEFLHDLNRIHDQE